jgi:hypothetical protein
VEPGLSSPWFAAAVCTAASSPGNDRPAGFCPANSPAGGAAATVIYLAGRLPGRSSDLPESRNGPDSPALLFGLAPGGVCRASLSPGCWWALTLRNRSSPTFSPLLRRMAGKLQAHGLQPVGLSDHPRTGAVFFLLHFPYPCGRWALPTTVSCGARTFLSRTLRTGADAPAASSGNDRPANRVLFRAAVGPRNGDDHLSSRPIARPIERPTRES